MRKKTNKLTAKNFKANMIKEQAEAKEELIAVLIKKHTQQMETLIKSTTKAMKQMMSLIKNVKKEPSSQTSNKKKKQQEERRKKYNNAPVFKNCGKKHPDKANDECWELENIKTLSHPTGNLPSVPEVESETWQPGKVISNKIKPNRSHLATTNYWAPLHKAEVDDDVKQINQASKVQSLQTLKQINGRDGWNDDEQ
jgi:hypothetical protein